jgi:hypothetical protein
MPDTTAALDTTKLADEISQKIQAAKSPAWKTALWWSLGIAAVVSIIAIIIVMIKKGASVNEAANYILDFSAEQVRKADETKKIEVARAEGVAEVKIDQIKIAMAIKDDYERAQALIAL